MPDDPKETKLYRVGALDAAPTFTGRARLDWSDLAGSRSREVTGKRSVIGSSPNADLVLNDATVSRVHAELEVTDEGVWVRDLQSSNGTWLQGVRVERALVPHLGRLRFGQTQCVLVHLHTAPDTRRSEPDLWPDASFGPLLGGSAKMRALYSILARIAPSEAPVLIHGETGTGKELVARSIHEASARATGPYVVVDCAALPETLLDAELFGHARGAFTGAANARAGAIESANGGTVFLDEIGELPRGVQPKLLRVLEGKTVRRLGENHHRPVDVRFVCATHRDLITMVSTGEFREDLFFRFSVLPVTVPPLRERLEDVDLLVQHFLGSEIAVVPALLAELHTRSWTGNVRELRNFVDRMRTLGSERALEMTGASVSSQRPPTVIPAAPLATELHGSLRTCRELWLERGERAYVAELLARHGRNVAAAAREAEVDRTYLYKLMRKYGIE